MPNNKNIFEHPYYSEEELVKRLKTKGLVIVNQPELIHYFQTFNYHNVINKYKTCFLANIHYWRYLRNANSQMIIDLFNFNRKLSLLIAPDLETIELQLATGIANVLMKRIGLFHAGRTIFGCLTAKEKFSLFRYGAEEKDNKKINELFSELQDNYAKLRKGDEIFNDNWLKWEEVPLYSLVLIFPFGINIDLFCNLNVEIQNEIFNTYFLNIKGINVRTFESLLYYFCYLRNKVCHRKPIYAFKFNINRLIYKVRKFNSLTNSKLLEIIKNDFLKLFDTNNLSQNNLKLLDLLKMLAKIVDDSLLEEKILQLIKWLEQSVKNGINHEGSVNEKYLPCKKAWENICLVLGYKK